MPANSPKQAEQGRTTNGTDPLLQDLNEAQRAAVCSTAPHLLVLAGAGTGKTRVLIHRIAWFIRSGLADRGQIMAVTFTNKASTELKERLVRLPGIEQRVGGILAGTFHSMARRQLVQHGEAIGLKPDFSIIDADDQKRLVRHLMRDQNINEKQYPVSEFVGWLNRHKDAARRAKDADDHSVFNALYYQYEERCRRGGLVDFSELLLAACEMMESETTIREHYRQRYSCLLVDEFQDTNAIQYRWLKNLTGKDTRTTAVGDDDQTIYTWRGARAENMQEYRTDFRADIIKLEQNYRSTERILAAADQVICHNENRLGKTLISSKAEGDKLCIYAAYNEQDEARFVANIAEDWHATDRKLSEIAVLYRSNTQSRVLEEEMLRSRIPYRIYGGTGFYSRVEIKDALAWLHLVHNPNDDLAFRRAIGVPKRGIGERTLERMHEMDPEQSLWLNARLFCAPGMMKHASMQKFIALLQTLHLDCEGQPLKKVVNRVLEVSGLLEMYAKVAGEGDLSRADNLRELAVAAGAFEKQLDKNLAESEEDEGGEDGEYPGEPLEQFLAEATLNSGDQQSTITSDYVNLMTLHASKGLEFPLVLMVGMEADLFPHIKSIQNQGLEEERRLCYVGMTRAMEKLYLSWAASRRSHGTGNFNRSPSRFLHELPPNLVEEMDGSMPAPEYLVQEPAGTGHLLAPEARAPAPEPSTNGGMRVGKHVSHKTFGNGVVLSIEGNPEDGRIKISFVDHGVKWLLLSHANLSGAKQGSG